MGSGINWKLNDEQKTFIRQRETMVRSDLSTVFNKKFNCCFSGIQMSGICKRMGLNTGRTGCFRKDHLPWNTGTKGFTSANKTSFSTGHRPANYRPVGSERITVNGYTEIKIKDPNKWGYKHVELYKKEKGRVPKGHIIIFLDSDKSNISVDNLKAVSRKLSLVMNRNKYGSTPNKFKPTVEVISQIQLKAGELKTHGS